MTIEQFKDAVQQIAVDEEDANLRAMAAILLEELEQVKGYDHIAAYHPAIKGAMDRARAEAKMVHIALLYKRLDDRFGGEVSQLLLDTAEELKAFHAAKNLAALEEVLSQQKPLTAETLDSMLASLKDAVHALEVLETISIEERHRLLRMRHGALGQEQEEGTTEDQERQRAYQVRELQRIQGRAQQASRTLLESLEGLQALREKDGDAADRALTLLRYEVRRFLAIRQFPDHFREDVFLERSLSRHGPHRRPLENHATELTDRERELLLAAASATLAWVNCHRAETEKRNRANPESPPNHSPESVA